MLLRQLGEVAGDDVPAGVKLKANSGEEASQPVVGPDLDGEGHVRLFLEFDLQISAHADGVLASGSAHARPSAQLPIDVSGNFPAHFSAE